ncbi:MAG: hypothetical protein COS87_01160 [Chloroflexi bacterium CG07_land_8_20_14_0_80_45_17]|nr:MAG: hypothetical protein COS87_01160 [Chloroflexi bacterium CG07_land_8_20_14_0_80_45_17]
MDSSKPTLNAIAKHTFSLRYDIIDIVLLAINTERKLKSFPPGYGAIFTPPKCMSIRRRISYVPKWDE